MSNFFAGMLIGGGVLIILGIAMVCYLITDNRKRR